MAGKSKPKTDPSVKALRPDFGPLKTYLEGIARVVGMSATQSLRNAYVTNVLSDFLNWPLGDPSRLAQSAKRGQWELWRLVYLLRARKKDLSYLGALPKSDSVLAIGGLRLAVVSALEESDVLGEKIAARLGIKPPREWWDIFTAPHCAILSVLNQEGLSEDWDIRWNDWRELHRQKPPQEYSPLMFRATEIVTSAAALVAAYFDYSKDGTIVSIEAFKEEWSDPSVIENARSVWMDVFKDEYRRVHALLHASGLQERAPWLPNTAEATRTTN